MTPFVQQSAAQRAFDGASRAVLPAFGAGAIIGLAAGIPVVLCAGAGAILGIVIGAVRGLARQT